MSDVATPTEPRTQRMSVEAYLRREEVAEERHEFRDGDVVAMSGGTFNHAAICVNLTSLLKRRLGDGPCRTLGSEMRVGIERGNRFVYPDAMIVCDEPRFDARDVKKTTLVNPRVVLEVLSDSTEAHDRGDKFTAYRELPSMKEYVLVAQRGPRIESYVRFDDGSWSFRTWSGLDAAAKLRCLDLDLPLAEVYDRITFESPE